MLKKLLLTCVAFSFAVTAAQAQMDDLLVVDLSVVDQVTISATAGVSAVTATGSDVIGVYLENFYGVAGGPLADNGIVGTADFTNAENPANGSPDVFRFGGGTDTGLNIWSWSSDTDVTFTTGSTAFVGAVTFALDPAEYDDMLAGNDSGNLYFPADDSGDIATAALLGTYSVVSIPEPGAMSLVALGLGLLMLGRRR